MDSDGDADVRSVMNALRRLVQSLRNAACAAEKAVGISGAQLFVLQSLSEHGTLSVSDLATRTATHQSSVSVVVSRLVGSGYVTTHRSKADARRLEITLTSDGRKLLKRAPEAAQFRLLRALRKLPKTKRAALARSLDALVREMGADAGLPALFFEDDDRKRKTKRLAT